MSSSAKAVLYAWAYAAEAVPAYQGWIKVGYTTGSLTDTDEQLAQRRIKGTTHTAGLHGDVVLLGVWPVPGAGPDADGAKRAGHTFEQAVHRTLQYELGVPRRTNGSGVRKLEFFRCGLAELEDAVAAVRTGRRLRPLDSFDMRPEQEEFVDTTSAYFTRVDAYPLVGGQRPRYLWNAKMRFGKTHATYRLAEKMGWQRLLVLTSYPSVASEWESNLLSHSAFKGWEFFTRVGSTGTAEEDLFTARRLLDSNGKLVWFASFQDVASKKGGDKAHVELLRSVEWDCVIIDEYHFGGQSDLNEAFLGIGDDEGVVELSAFDSQENSTNALTRAKRFLMLSGTPFKALASAGFPIDAIQSWTYADEQLRKQQWNPADGHNPYAALPELTLCTYEIPEHVLTHGTEVGQDEFSLNRFFKVDSDSGQFIHESDILRWLDVIAGQSLEEGARRREAAEPARVFPYENQEFSVAVQHSLWLLPNSVQACLAMGALLKSHHWFGKHYSIHVTAGDAPGGAAQTLRDCRNFIGGHGRTITVSCRKLTTGVTVPEWGSVFMLTDTESPELYFQAAFRAQSPQKGPNGEVLKERCFVFDFAPNRSLALIADYAVALRGKRESRAGSREKAIEDLIRFLPVIAYSGGALRRVDAGAIMRALLAGESAEAVREGFKGKRGVTQSVEILGQVVANERLWEWMLKTEKRVNAKQLPDLKKARRVVVNAHDSIKKAHTSKDPAQADEATRARKAARPAVDVVRSCLKFITEQIPTFLYLSSHPEEELVDVIINQEPEIFFKAVGIPADVVLELHDLGVFNTAFLDRLVYKFLLLEDESLELLHPGAAARRRAAFGLRTPATAVLDEGVELAWERHETVLGALSGSSSGQHLTPHQVASEMLDKLPKSLWSNPGARILDPVCKSGVFLFEAAMRLDQGLAAVIPNKEARRRHILTSMLYGIGTTYVNAAISRRTLYGAKEANHPLLTSGLFSTEEGNILFPATTHNFVDGRCAVAGCGLPETDLANSDEGRENHAYPFSHMTKEAIETLFRDAQGETMKFDVIIGNPPYQINDGGGGHGASAKPIYHQFVLQAKRLGAQYISFIIPARWFAGGKGLDDFRSEMIADRQISHMVDYPKLFEVFPVEIKGGVCYFLRDQTHDGDCEFTTIRDLAVVSTSIRDLRHGVDVVLRDELSTSIAAKVRAKGVGTLEGQVSARKPFGLPSKYRGTATKPRNGIRLYQNGGTAWIKASDIPARGPKSGDDWTGQHLVLVPFASDGHGRLPAGVLGAPIVAGPGSACTETYLVAGRYKTKLEASNFAAYVRTKFFRYLVHLRKPTQNGARGVYEWVPSLPMTKLWTDQDLYVWAGLSQDEIDHIEETIKTM